jgi:chromosome partitioning protein
MNVQPLRVAILGRKGGSAKTTTAYNLAGALAASGRRCLLIDLDAQASMTRALYDQRVAADQGIGARIAATERGLQDAILHIDPRIDLAPGDRSIEATALALAQNPAGPLRLRLLVDGVAPAYDAVIIDTAPLLGFTQTSALLAGDVKILMHW